MLGKLFGLEITNKFSGIEERQQRGEQTLVTDDRVSVGVPHGSAPPAGLSKEERKIHLEAIVSSMRTGGTVELSEEMVDKAIKEAEDFFGSASA